MVKKRSLSAFVTAAVLSMALPLPGAHASARSEDQSVIQAERSLAGALKDPEGTSAAELLDSDLAWTDAEGQTRDKAATVKNLSKFAADNWGDSGKSIPTKNSRWSTARIVTFASFASG